MLKVILGYVCIMMAVFAVLLQAGGGFGSGVAGYMVMAMCLYAGGNCIVKGKKQIQ